MSRNPRWNPATRHTIAGEPGFEQFAASVAPPSKAIDRSLIPYNGYSARPGFRLFYTVSGRGQFPGDMLRYDSCVAHGDMGIAGTLETRETREIKILSAKSCTPERWRSFGWSVHDDIIERAAPVSVSIDY